MPVSVTTPGKSVVLIRVLIRVDSKIPFDTHFDTQIDTGLDTSGPHHGGMGTGPNRRRRSAEGPRARRVEVLLSAAEAAELTKRAEAAHVSLARYLVESALDRHLTPAERRLAMAELFRVKRMVGTMATSLDQLARKAILASEPSPDTRKAFEAVEDLGVAVTTIARAAGYTVEPEA